MSTIKFTALTIGFVGVLWAAHAAPPPASLTMIPPQINYQGRLVTPANAPYADANHSIDLSLYPSASGGAKIWSERYTVQTRDGYFSVNLGSGGTGLLASNLPIWQVMWNGSSGGGETNNFFMALTVRTDQNGVAIASPVEATPRQQFLTAPFAYRAHQSVYARKADTTFEAPQGIVTSSITSTNNQVDVNGSLKVGNTVYANNVVAHGASPQMTVSSAGGVMRLGLTTTTGPFGIPIVTEAASAIQIGAQSTINGIGSDVALDGRNIDIGTTNLTVNNQPMFIYKTVNVPVTAGSLTTDVPHGISTSAYDIFVVGHYTSSTTQVRGAYTYPDWTFGRFAFNTTPSSGSVWMWFLGVRKGLTKLN